MDKEFITYEQALALKELGFDEPCLKIWEKTMLFTTLVNPEEFKRVVSERYTKAPTFSQAFRWFRDVHELEGVPQKADSFSWFKFCIWKYISNGKHRVNDAFGFEYKTYEEAEQACLDKLIEIVRLTKP
jgi:hypothetical protein